MVIITSLGNKKGIPSWGIIKKITNTRVYVEDINYNNFFIFHRESYKDATGRWKMINPNFNRG